MKNKCSDCCHPKIINSEACGCCEGVEIVTPLSTANRPGLSQLSYLIGTHASFLETMKARLSNSDYPELAGLTTREADDTSIALLDAWATVADVLTFYQERIANEGYLRTATERRSILELARLVGYRLRPGVASSVFLAYTIDENTKEETIIPVSSRAQSVPGPGELPQSFETSEELKARAGWNNLKPRMTQPQTFDKQRVYLKGINTNLKPNDLLLIGPEGIIPTHYRVNEVKTDTIADSTLVVLQSESRNSLFSEEASGISKDDNINYVELINNLTLRPSHQHRNSLQLGRKLDEQFIENSGTGYQTVSSFSPQLRETLTLAAANAMVTSTSKLKVFALRTHASLFGHNAPKEPEYNDNGIFFASNLKRQPWSEWEPDGESGEVLHLDRSYDQILQGSHIVIENLLDDKTIVTTSNSVQSISRSAYGISGETTKITLPNDVKWWNPKKNRDETDSDVFDINISKIRTTKIYAQSEELELAEEPIETTVSGGNDELLELDGFYEGLESGRWVIVSGERVIPGTSGVRFSELAMLSSVEHRFNEKLKLSGDKTHTFVKLAKKLEFEFKRDTVTIYGNVVKATHGETRNEVMGSGDGSKALQLFDLKQFPLTHVSAPNPSGVDSTLEVFVNDVQWHEVDSLAGLQKVDRKFITKTDNEDKTTVIFGNGKEGARLPTGIENIKAGYRNGIGRQGNVIAEQITLLATKPLGVKEVINPLRASGGADRENRELARKSAPLAVKALDRLVSVRDYEDFSRIYGGIGKASATEISDGRRQIVHVTIAGADDIPIDETSDLFMNLCQALHDFGDPFIPIQLDVRELMFIFISVNIRILSDYQWEPVVTELRAALLEAFSFERRELGQDVLLSEVISEMQKVKGVDYVDVDFLGGIPEREERQVNDGEKERLLLSPDEIVAEVQDVTNTDGENNKLKQRIPVNMAGRDIDKNETLIHPAQLAYLTPDVPETLIINQIK